MTLENLLIENTNGEVFSLSILKLIKEAQQQHGLRHGDYQRYRGYCSRRIRRLRKVLKIAQGDRRHFKKKNVTEEHLKNSKGDERFLHIPLILSERCWAYAMQLRQESNTEPRKKFHLIQRLRKACIYAMQLEELCLNDRCDARTKLEAQAYVAWIHGNLQFELQLWIKATENLKKAQVIYEKLMLTVHDNEQLIYKQRIDEITPSLRYCAYNIGDEKAVDLLELRSQGILDNLDELVSQTTVKTATILHEIEWFSVVISVTIERVRLFLLSIEKLDESLAHADSGQARIKILENLFIDLRDIIRLARDSAKTKNEQLLLIYLLSIRVERTSQRNLLLIKQTRKPQDCVRLLDINLQQTNELSQNEFIKDIKIIQNYYNEQINAYKRIRLYYLGRVHFIQKRFKEAAILFNLTTSCNLMKNDKFSYELNELIQMVDDNAKIDLIISKANYVLDVQDDNELNLPQKIFKTKKPLITRLNEFHEEVHLLTKNPNIVYIPPELKPIPVKPLFYDLALNFIEFPDLKDKLQTNTKKQGAGLSEFVKGLWGWRNN